LMIVRRTSHPHPATHSSPSCPASKMYNDDGVSILATHNVYLSPTNNVSFSTK
jgi:hypothetical protein